MTEEKKENTTPETQEQESQTTPDVKEEDKEKTEDDTPKEEVTPTPEPTSDPAPSPEPEEEVEVPAEFKDLVEKVEKMSVLELNQLVKVLEKKFGVSAAAVAVAGPAAGDADGAEVKDSFDVELTSDGGAKIPVMKVVKEVLGLGLKEAKDLVDAAPSVLKTGMKKEEAEALQKQIEEAGGKVTLK